MVVAARPRPGARSAAVRDLLELIAIPSVSSDPRHRRDVLRCAQWLQGRLRRAGLPRVEIARTAGHPAVLGWTHRVPGRRTVLIYGHYDVQPAGEGWATPPFQGVVRNGAVYGRGASDDKGQLLCHVHAVESLLREGRLGCNLIFVLDGEEEIGSPNLPPVLRSLRRYRPDVAVLSDTQMLGPDQPAITVGLRGSMTVVILVRRPGAELHSGRFGGGAPDPGAVLSRLIAGLHDRAGRIAVEGFYRRVRVSAPRTSREVVTTQPAIVVTGMGAGHPRGDPKSSIPAEAWARLNVRLALAQDPAESAAQIQRHLRARIPQGLTATIEITGLIPPVEVDRRDPAMRAAARAYRVGFGEEPAFVRSGGTIPAVGQLQRELRVPVVMMAFASPTDGAHGPNEHFSLSNLARGTQTSRALLDS